MLESLSPLRADLRFYPSTPTATGAPTWVIYDPLRHRYFQIGALEFTLLRHWKEGLSSEDLARKARNESSQRIDTDSVEQLHTFLYQQQLLRPLGEGGLKFLKTLYERTRHSQWKSLSHRYLFFRVPIWQPDRFLSATLPWVRPLMRMQTLWLLLVLAVLGVFLVSRQWDSFLSSFPYLFTLPGIATFALTLAFVKITHELGHAYAAKRYGLKIPYIGVAFLVLWPVLYTDTSHAWRLTSRRQRLWIDAAGLTVELSIAVLATLLWSFLPDGVLRSAVFMVATVTWLMTLLVNVNPFMRFDGYYLLADLWGVSNLQERSFAHARWWMREMLFGFGDPPPEALPERQQHLFVLYAFGTWIYRFFLFLGIATLVYYLFFKVMGIFLMLLEVIMLLLIPILKEISYWWKRREDMHWNRHTVASLLLLSALLLVLFYPWQRYYSAPALYRAQQQQVLYMPHSGQLVFSALADGKQVQEGEVLVRLHDPDLDEQLQSAELEAAYLSLQLEAEATDAELRERQQVMRQQLAEARAEIAKAKEQQEQLTLRAPFSGELRQIASEVIDNAWINSKMPLAVLVNPQQTQISAYVSEQMIAHIDPQQQAKFYPDNPDFNTFKVQIQAVELQNIQQLPQREQALASIFGGEIAVRQDPQSKALIPEQAIYRVLLSKPVESSAPRQVQVGSVYLGLKEEQSIAESLWKSVLAVLIRESGF